MRLRHGADIQVDFSDKPMVGILNVKELLTDMYADYSERALAFIDKYRVPLVLSTTPG